MPASVVYDTSGGKCAYRHAKFRIEANITLPRWRGVTSSNPDLRSAWKFLAAYARQHEEVHVKIAEKHAARIAEELEALSPRKDCDALDDAAERILKRVKVEHNREQLAFDRQEQKRLAALYD